MWSLGIWWRDLWPPATLLNVAPFGLCDLIQKILRWVIPKGFFSSNFLFLLPNQASYPTSPKKILHDWCFLLALLAVALCSVTELHTNMNSSEKPFTGLLGRASSGSNVAMSTKDHHGSTLWPTLGKFSTERLTQVDKGCIRVFMVVWCLKKGGREGGKENSENGNKFISWDKGKTMVPLYLKS